MSASKLEELDLTQAEVERFAKAFKDEKFRSMLCEYAEEISNPENKKKYEEEITQLEKERGVDIKFVHPNPGYVLKTSVSGDKKCFINVCSNDLINKPVCKAGKGANGTVGQHWSLPYSLAPGREDLSAGGRKHMIYDVVFHPDTLYMASKNAKFKKMVDQTSIDVIEKQLNAKLDLRNAKTLKVKYKGLPDAAVIRKPTLGGPKESPEEDDPLRFPYPFDPPKSKTASENDTKAKTTSKGSKTAAKDENTNMQDSKFTQPKYSIVYRSHFDLQDYRYAREAAPSTRPKELVVTIDLPLLKSAENACLDVTEKLLCLESQKPAYKLDVPLPYSVDENLGSAKFNKSKRQLVVTLPVLPVKQPCNLKIKQDHNSDLDQTGESSETTESGQSLCESELCQLEGHSHQQNRECAGACINPEGEFCALQDFNLEKSQNNEHLELSQIKTSTESEVKEAALVSNNSFVKINDVIACPKLLSEVDSDEQENGAKEDTLSGPDIPGTMKKACSHSVGGQVNDHLQVDSSDHLQIDSSANTEFCSDNYLKKTEPVRPDFHYHQNEDSITFILQVRNINEESFKSVLHTHEYNVIFGTQDSDALYSLVVQFPPEHQLDTAESILNISQDNAAVVLVKSPECRGLWQSFHAGDTHNCLQKRLFVTSENIDQFLNTSLEDPIPNELTEKHPMVINVAEVSENGLVINSKQQETNNTNSQGASLKPDRINPSDASNPGSNIQQHAEEICFSESTARGNILDKEIPKENDAVEFVSSLGDQLVAVSGTCNNFTPASNTAEGTITKIPRDQADQLTSSNCLTPVDGSKLNSEVEIKSQSMIPSSQLSMANVEDPTSVNCKKSVNFKRCVKVDDNNVLDEDDLPSDQKSGNSPEFTKPTAAPQILEEINPADGSVKIITDHRTHSAFKFQNTELYQLD
ncbi:protein kintoun [Scyliorhinus torazame]|uniref:protein kintoun n=1 Tax=Scyliorhinus torazame TaxID=75743 RepID=UPI003B5BE8BD